MLRKDSDIKWIAKAKQPFEEIKKAHTQAPVLINPNFSKDFLVFTFASEHTIVGVLLQKRQQGNEQPIYFLNRTLVNFELKYSVMRNKHML